MSTHSTNQNQETLAQQLFETSDMTNPDDLRAIVEQLSEAKDDLSRGLVAMASDNLIELNLQTPINDSSPKNTLNKALSYNL